MKKNYYPPITNSFNSTIIVISILFFFIFNIDVKAQTCSVNAGDLNIQACVNNPIFVGVGGSSGGDIDTVLWEQLSGPSVIIVNPNVIPIEIQGAVAGTYEFRLSATCLSGNNSLAQVVTLTVFDITIADAGNNIASCPGTYALSANAPGPGESGSWSFPGGNPAGVILSNPTSPTTSVIFPDNSAGTTVLEWRIENTNPNPLPDIGSTTCVSTDFVSLTNYGGDLTVSAGSDQFLSECYTSATSTTLSGSQGGVGLGGQSGTWTFVSGPTVPSGLPANASSVALSGLIEGTYVFRYSVSGPCASGEDTVSVTIPPATQDISSSSVVNNLVFCSSVTETVLTGSQPEYAGETVEWTQTSGPVINEATALNTVFATTPTTSITGLNGSSSYTFRYIIRGGPINPGCQSAAEFVNVGYVNTAANIELNNGINLVELPPGATSGSVLITTVTGGNSYSIEQLAGPATATLSISGSQFFFEDLNVAGTYTFNVIRNTSGQVLTSCEPASDFINVVVSLFPGVANPGTATFLPCGNTSGPLVGNPPTPAGATGFWSQVSGPVTATIDLDPSVANNTVSGLTIPGEYVFRWTVSGGPAVVSAQGDVVITVTEPLSSNPGDDKLRATGTDICPETFLLKQIHYYPENRDCGQWLWQNSMVVVPYQLLL